MCGKKTERGEKSWRKGKRKDSEKERKRKSGKKDR